MAAFHDPVEVDVWPDPLSKLRVFESGFLLFVLLIALLHSSWCAAAPEITELQALNFGAIAVRDNTVVSTVRVSANGSPSYTGQVLFVSAPSPGVYRVTGLPPFVTLSLSMLSSPATMSGQVGGATLTVASPLTQPSELRTNAQGEVEFRLGASMNTSGNSTLYEDGVYQAYPTLELSFALEGEIQTAKLDIEAAITLRSALDLSQVQELDFGRIVAFSAATDQASYTLHPNGAAHVSTPGSARIIRFGNSNPARIRVSGGAPFASISLDLPDSVVYLTHSSRAAEVARLEVDSFTVLPVPGEMKLDANGALELRIGATLKTEQSARRYADGEYTGTYSLTVNY